jgi:hypothetical protein
MCVDVQVLGDQMPQIHLPSWDSQKFAYARYKMQGESDYRSISLSQFMPVDRLSINAHIRAARQLDPQTTLGCPLCLRSGSRTRWEEPPPKGLKCVYEAFGGRPWGGS